MTVIDEDQAAGHIHGICLKTGPPRRTGVELEWLVRDVRDPALPVAAGRLAAAVAVFGAGRAGTDRNQGTRDPGGAKQNRGDPGRANPGREKQNRGERVREKPDRGERDQEKRGREGLNGKSPDERGQHGRDAGKRDWPELPTSTRPGVLPSG